MRVFDPLEYDDIKTLCDINTCDDCPRMGDDCDGRDEEDKEWQEEKAAKGGAI